MEAFVGDMRQFIEHSKRLATPVAEPKTKPMIYDAPQCSTGLQGPQVCFIATSGVGAAQFPLWTRCRLAAANPAASQSRTWTWSRSAPALPAFLASTPVCCIRPKAGFLEDLQSTNGFYVNEVRLLPRRSGQVALRRPGTLWADDLGV
jgi:hypothetical protein